MGGAEVRDGAPQEMLWLQELDSLRSPLLRSLLSRLQNATQSPVSDVSQGHLIPDLTPDPAYPVSLAVTSPLWVPFASVIK